MVSVRMDGDKEKYIQLGEREREGGGEGGR